MDQSAFRDHFSYKPTNKIVISFFFKANEQINLTQLQGEHTKLCIWFTQRILSLDTVSIRIFYDLF